MLCCVVPLSPTYGITGAYPGVTYLFSWYIGTCSRKSGENAESIIRSGQTMLYTIRESWLGLCPSELRSLYIYLCMQECVPRTFIPQICRSTRERNSYLS